MVAKLLAITTKIMNLGRNKIYNWKNGTMRMMNLRLKYLTRSWIKLQQGSTI